MAITFTYLSIHPVEANTTIIRDIIQQLWVEQNSLANNNFGIHHRQCPPRAVQDFVNSSATLSFVPLVSAGSGFAVVSPLLSAGASAAAFLSLSASSILISFPPTRSFDSFSSSLSPRLNGSLSASPIGLGSTVDKGCHLLCLPDGGAFSVASFGEER